MKQELPKTFDFARLCRDRGIGVAHPGHRHSRSGWVAVHCPLCGLHADDGYYLGYSEASGIFTCWRCGRENKGKVGIVAKLCNVSTRDAFDLILKYAGVTRLQRWKEEVPLAKKTEQLVLPGDVLPMECHREYLQKRRFDLDFLVRRYGIRFCGRVGDYKYRIMIPVMGWHDDAWKVVSYQGRDATGSSALRYKACTKAQELVHHKHLIYNQARRDYGRILVVEGVFDAWRMGERARATFGIAYTKEQVAELAKHEEVIIMYDCEEVEAQRQADKLAWDVTNLGGSAKAVNVKTGGRDPAELEDEEVCEINRQLGFTL